MPQEPRVESHPLKGMRPVVLVPMGSLPVWGSGPLWTGQDRQPCADCGICSCTPIPPALEREGIHLSSQRLKGDQVSFLSSWTPDCRTGMRKAPLSPTCKMLPKDPGQRRSAKAHTPSRAQSPPSKSWNPVGLRSLRRSWCLQLRAGNGDDRATKRGFRRLRARSPRWQR